MKTFKCGMCKDTIVAVKKNTEGIVYFDEKYWHHDCFIQECTRRIKTGRSTKYNWQEVLEDIDKWQEQANVHLKFEAEKDDVFNFIVANYRISRTNNNLFTRLSSIYNGSYPGLLYAISPKELLDEWEYYMQYLRDARKWKDMTDTQALPYDLAVLLSKNLEYREMVAKKNVEEQVREAQKVKEKEIDISAIHAPVTSGGNKRLAAIYDDFMGGDL